MSRIVPKPTSRFLRVKCKDCGYEQAVYGKANLKITCLGCGTLLTTPTGGKAIIHGEIIGVYDND
jgi:small subunit ribosomal protein S27e